MLKMLLQNLLKIQYSVCSCKIMSIDGVNRHSFLYPAMPAKHNGKAFLFMYAVSTIIFARIVGICTKVVLSLFSSYEFLKDNSF